MAGQFLGFGQLLGLSPLLSILRVALFVPIGACMSTMPRLISFSLVLSKYDVHACS